MILVDSSVWIDHIRLAHPRLVSLLEEATVLTHPLVIGEIALGSLRDRQAVVGHLTNLPMAVEASHEEVLQLIERHALFSRGLGYIDAQLLASTLLTPGSQLWTKDKRFRAAAETLGVASD
jgi:predicted nucleic acid-binding protein